MELLRAALDYVGLGWYVFPLLPRMKVPAAGSKGFKDASCDLEQIKIWWTECPNANIGLACCISQILAVDVDEDEENNHHGIEDWNQIVKQYHIDDNTWTNITGRGGMHLLYKVPVNIKINPPKNLLDCNSIDLKWNGYIILPPSIHPNGKKYAWEVSHRPDETKIKHLPDALLNLFTDPNKIKPQKLYEERPEKIAIGRRDNYFNSLSGYWWKIGAVNDPESFVAKCEEYNQRMPAPFTPIELKKVIESGLKYQRDKVRRLTDLANAERLVDHHRDELRYCYKTERWHIWDGCAWMPDERGQIHEFAQELVRDIMHEQIEINPGELNKVLALQSHIRIKAMIEESKPMLSCQPQNFDNDPMLLNCQNGIVDLRNATLLPHNPDLMLSKLAPVNHDPNAKYQLWERFVDDITLGDETLKSFLQRLAGLSLTGLTDEQYFFILYGDGNNGKTTFVECMRELLGTYSLAVPAEGITIKKYGMDNKHQMARLPGIRLATVSETEKGEQLAESLIKQFTGGGEINAEMKYGHPFSFRPVAKIWIETNFKPVIRGRDKAIWRRVILVPFLFHVEKRQKDLRTKLSNELPGILNWAIQGCLDLQQHGLKQPEKVLDAVKEYKAESDVLGEFIQDHFIVEDGGTTRFGEARQLYVDWCKANNEEPRSSTWLGKALSERFEKVNIGHNNERGYKGIRVKAMKDSIGF
jgi:P4 family phage/plasmid primase-like protien